ncbi:class I SAM-dependent RNA methyltransferase [Rubrivivax rivuli]|uniref:Class I SAM-dependent RNA methyltransferase n=2 Tax=Rubrivivax rivuli TaxID=1862385 RepID=A0A437RQL0_9BURK|nr:class I SAM-dependent RNA methyltransferase [Rubrivivax rivuli]
MMPGLFLPCAGGVEALLADEVQRITGTTAEATRGGVWVEGDARTAMRLNLESRLATRVLWPLIDGYYRDEHDLYELARRVPWGEWISPAQTLRVDVSAQRSPLQSLNFAALRIKDAVCDTLREQTGERPSVDTRRPDLPIALFVGPEHATLYVDTSGEALFKRGWREDTGEAPLKETLAAAMLAAAGWQGRAEDGPLFDPCCGAGTIAVEAAQMACGIAPGGQRRFAFERLLPFRAHMAAWREMQQAAQARVHAPAVAVYAGDVSFRMTDFATRNAERAGVLQAIDFKTADALQRPPPAERGVILMNPPYGERIAPKGQGTATAREGFEGGGSSAEFFGALAANWKRQYPGWTAWLLSPDMKLPGLMRLKESRRVPMWNGPIECRLFRFDLVAGTHRG